MFVCFLKYLFVFVLGFFCIYLLKNNKKNNIVVAKHNLINRLINRLILQDTLKVLYS